MLAFDLETTGLDPKKHVVTCACVYSRIHSIDACFFFNRDDPEVFFKMLDDAPVLCAFNGARFDLPFLQVIHYFPFYFSFLFLITIFQISSGVDARRIYQWRLKLFDVYETCKLGLGVTFSLNSLLAANGMMGKSGDGGKAVSMFNEGRYAELASYCRDDTVLTYNVSTLDVIQIPGNPQVVLRPHNRQIFYVQPQLTTSKCTKNASV